MELDEHNESKSELGIPTFSKSIRLNRKIKNSRGYERRLLILAFKNLQKHLKEYSKNN